MINSMLQRIRNAPPRYWLVVVVALLFAGLPTVVSSFSAGLWAHALIFVIAIMGLNILIGYSGQLSLGHGAFVALGAYTMAILVRRYHVQYVVIGPQELQAPFSASEAYWQANGTLVYSNSEYHVYRTG